ncbi:LysR family transcriptional regulator [Duganella aceris]|uniref:LysR family transcriptional regulator n=1 Tax=Duganella aceris TaxID=2703883 RepID=A0ABX0FIP6_9BURK|nr:LysR family transcriptional regulator [Duganella aceris]NGZ84429.1 LysR family transcriptional regulator [Duganella aceris]
MHDRLFTLRLFVRVARKGSFSAAGRELKIPQPTVSRLIATLEQDIGAALLTRTTRAVTLTEAGADFLARVEPVLDALDDAEHAARGGGRLRGVLRVGVSSSMAIRGLMPHLQAFLDQHPDLRVELLLDDLRQNLVAEGVDVGLRFGPLPDSSATAQRLGAAERVLAASPDYLRRAGTPHTPAELAQHSVIAGPGRLAHAWSFTRDGKTLAVRVDGQLSVSVNEVSTAAALAGIGIASMTLGACLKELQKGSLVRLLADWSMGDIELHAVFPAGRAAKPAARAFADHVAKNLGHMLIQ